MSISSIMNIPLHVVTDHILSYLDLDMLELITRCNRETRCAYIRCLVDRFSKANLDERDLMIRDTEYVRELWETFNVDEKVLAIEEKYQSWMLDELTHDVLLASLRYASESYGQALVEHTIRNPDLSRASLIMHHATIDQTKILFEIFTEKLGYLPKELCDHVLDEIEISWKSLQNPDTIDLIMKISKSR